MRNMKKRILSAALGLLTAISVLPIQTFAAGKIQTDHNVTMEIQYHYGETALADVEFELYRVADISEYAQFTLTGDFKQYSVKIGEYSGAKWNELASTLDGYVARDKMKADGPKAVDSGKTDANGKLSFPAQQQEMKPGLYLLIGSSKSVGSYRYSCDPAIVCVPNEDKQENDWNYDVTVFPKSNRTMKPGGDEPSGGTVTRKVLKRWEDSGSESIRPDSIEVSLLKDGSVYDTVTLSSANNWSYTWTGLNKSSEWKVTEDVPSGYTVLIGREGITFVVKNTIIPTVEITDREPPLSPFAGDIPLGVLGATDENLPFGLLPQTGTTWWLAAALAGAGMLFFAMGLVLEKNKK